MGPGKLASQAGHAYLGAWTLCPDNGIRDEYHSTFPASPGTKICLGASSRGQIHQARAMAEALDIPSFLVVDSGCPDFFDGQPTVTALGLGPARRHEIKPITKRFKLIQ